MPTVKTPARLDAPFDPANEETKPYAEFNHDWWAPVWQGLVLDREGRHYKKMGTAIWLFAYFILCADRRTGSLRRKAATISRQMGVKVRSIRAWLKILRQGGYVETDNSGRSLLIRIQKWKTYPQRQSDAAQSDVEMSGRVTESCHSETRKNSSRTALSSHKPVAGREANDITIKKDIYNDKVGDPRKSAAKENALAWGICQALKDEASISLYRSYVRKYPPTVIQKAFRGAMRIPPNKIKKTRGALFNYLVRHYAAK